MRILDQVQAAHDGDAMVNIGRRYGLDGAQTEQAMRVLLPVIMHAMRRLSESRTGAAAMHAIMYDERYDHYIDDPEALDSPSAQKDGETLLRELYGSVGKGRAAAREVAARKGVDPEVAERLFPIAALLAVGALCYEHREDDSTPTAPGHFGTRPDDVGGEPLARAIEALLDDELSVDEALERRD